MLEYQPKDAWPALWITGSPDSVKSEADAKNSSDGAVGDAVAAEVKQNPSRDHGDNRGLCRPR
jgi:hypothetical protein